MTELSSVSGLRGVREAQFRKVVEWLHQKMAAAQNLPYEEGDVCLECADAVRDELRPLMEAALSLPPSPQPVAEPQQLTEFQVKRALLGNGLKWWPNAQQVRLVTNGLNDVLRRAPVGAQGQVQEVQASEADEMRRLRQSYRLWDGRAADVSSQAGQAQKEYRHFLHCNGDRRIPAGEPGNCCSCFNTAAAPRIAREGEQVSAPFEKFRVRPGYVAYGKFIVFVWPNGYPSRGWGLIDPPLLDKEQAQFIEDAIREKLEREREQKK